MFVFVFKKKNCLGFFFLYISTYLNFKKFLSVWGSVGLLTIRSVWISKLQNIGRPRTTLKPEPRLSCDVIVEEYGLKISSPSDAKRSDWNLNPTYLNPTYLNPYTYLNPNTYLRDGITLYWWIEYMSAVRHGLNNPVKTSALMWHHLEIHTPALMGNLLKAGPGRNIF